MRSGKDWTLVRRFRAFRITNTWGWTAKTTWCRAISWHRFTLSPAGGKAKSFPLASTSYQSQEESSSKTASICKPFFHSDSYSLTDILPSYLSSEHKWRIISCPVLPSSYLESVRWSSASPSACTRNLWWSYSDNSCPCQSRSLHSTSRISTCPPLSSLRFVQPSHWGTAFRWRCPSVVPSLPSCSSASSSALAIWSVRWHFRSLAAFSGITHSVKHDSSCWFKESSRCCWIWWVFGEWEGGLQVSNSRRGTWPIRSLLSYPFL